MSGGKDRPVPAGIVLRVIEGFYAGLELPIDRPQVVIGRGRGSDYPIADTTLSRCHAAFGFDLDEGGCNVEDLGSTNGTLVNGQRQREAPLAHGDEIQIGHLKLRLLLPTTLDRRY